MRQAFTMLGVMTIVMVIGTFLAFRHVEAPAREPLNQIATTSPLMKLTLTSPAFKDGERIPAQFTCDGKNINPELRIGGVPEGTQSLVLVMDDPDIPDSVRQARGIEKFDHWVLYNIPPDTTVIAAGNTVGTRGANSTGNTAYVGPCPPDREHRYIFRLYALSGMLSFDKAPTLDEVESATKRVRLESASLTGLYERSI